MKKNRLDLHLAEQGLATSRVKAQALVMAGLVYVNGIKQTKSGFQVSPEDEISVRENPVPFVSRGGLKLQKALEKFDINLNGSVCLDVGASTGGFTDCMLQNGASRVYAVDVGYNQLDWSLRSDDRVISIERTNFRRFNAELISDSIDFASVDVSFISLTNILPSLKELLDEGILAVCLIKPQFEVGREKVGKKGVVREASSHVEAINKVIGFAIENNFNVLDLDFSPIKGPQGNIEYLILLEKSSGKGKKFYKEKISDLVDFSHNVLSGGD